MKRIDVVIVIDLMTLYQYVFYHLSQVPKINLLWLTLGGGYYVENACVNVKTF